MSISQKLLQSTAAFVTFVALSHAHAATVFINEFHYDNTGADTGEFVEVAGTAGTDLSGWSIVLYNGSNGTTYATYQLNTVLADQSSGFGFEAISLPTNGIQNGSPDGIALVDAMGTVVETLAYEGSFTASNGVASGIQFIDIGVQETSGTPVGTSISRVGMGLIASDFTWATSINATLAGLNDGQSFGDEVPLPAAAWFMGAGAATLVMRRRRQK